MQGGRPTSSSSVTVDLAESRLPSKVIGLAWPVVAEQVFTALVNITSTIMVGHLGAASLAGVGLATQAVWLPQVVAQGVSVGATAVIARRIGQGRHQEASRALHQSVLMAALVGLAFLPLGWYLAEHIMVLFRAQADVVPLGANYIRPAALGLVPALIMFACNAGMRGAGHTRTPMIIMIITNSVNVSLAYALIYGALGLPALGVLGAGIAAACAWTVGCIVALARLQLGVGPLHYQFRRAFSFELQTARRILAIGLPAGMEQLQVQIAFTIYSVIISGLGTTVYAAHMVALRLENLAFMPGFGLGIAATTLVGQSLGAGRPDLAERAARLAQWYAVILMTVLGFLMAVFRRELMGVFVSDLAVIEIGTLGVLIYAFSLPLMGTSNTLAGGLRGAGDTRAVMLIMAASVWLVRLPLAYTLAYEAEFGAPGAWSAAVLDISMRGMLSWRRFASGHWKTIRV